MSHFPGIDRLRALHPSYRLGVPSGLLFVALFSVRIALLYSPPSEIDVVGAGIFSVFPDARIEWLSLAIPGVISGIALAAHAYRVEHHELGDLRLYVSLPGTILSVGVLCIVAVPIVTFVVVFVLSVPRSLSFALSDGFAFAFFGLLLAAVGGTYLTAIAVATVILTTLPTYVVAMAIARFWASPASRM